MRTPSVARRVVRSPAIGFLLLALAVVTPAACSAAPARPEAKAPASAPLRVLGLGDSVMSTTDDDGRAFLDVYADRIAARTGRVVEVTMLADGGSTSTSVADALTDDADARAAVAGADVIVLSVGGNDSDPFATYPDGMCRPEQPLAECLEQYDPVLVPNYRTILGEVTTLRAGRPTAVRITTDYNPFIGWTEAPSPTFGVDFYRQVEAAATQALCGLASEMAAVCVDTSRLFNGPDGSHDAKRYLAEDHAHPGPRGVRAIGLAIVKSGLDELG